MSSVYRFFDKVRGALRSSFTMKCVCCGRAVSGGGCLCEGCTAKLLPADEFSPAETKFFTCGAAKFCYGEAAKAVIHGFKFSEDYLPCFDMLFSWLLSAFDENFAEEKIDCIVSVPAFGGEKSRFSLLAKKLSLYRDIPYSPALIKKIRKTEKQHSLSAAERRTNLLGAFEADEKARGKTVLLVDDIFTTGSTANECSKALLEKGAERVLVLTVFKTAAPGARRG